MGAALRKMREKQAGEETQASRFTMRPTLKPSQGHSAQAGGHFAAGGNRGGGWGGGVGGGGRKCHESLQRADPDIHLRFVGCVATRRAGNGTEKTETAVRK